jgi:hypothetical protein
MVVASGAIAMAQPPEGGPPGGPGGERRGPPSPERFIEHAFEYDADGDGKLDRSEFTKFAHAFHEMRMRHGPGGPPGRGEGPRAGGRGPGSGEGRGLGGPGDERRGPPPGGDGEPPERPRRPE